MTGLTGLIGALVGLALTLMAIEWRTALTRRAEQQEAAQRSQRMWWEAANLDRALLIRGLTVIDEGVPYEQVTVIG